MDERLEQLVTQAKRHAPQTEGWQLAITQLVDKILRSRKIGRPPIGQPLSGVYQEIYEQVRQQLLHKVGEELSNYNPTRTPVRTWVNTLQNHAFRTVLDDAQLKKLALEAQRHPPHTELRQHALGELVEAIRLSGKLGHPHRTRFSPQFYDLLYEEAVNKTLTYVCRKIDKYDPERGQDKKFMTWVNFRLDRVIIETSREFRDPIITDLPSLTDLEERCKSDESPSLFDKVRESIEEDAKNLFKQAHIRNHMNANFQAIALARFSGQSWEEISAKFGIPLPTLSSFFQRCCEKFRSQFRQ
jgi:DNA-directed RNA polymerase specialized sigma24 family protein